MPEAGVTAALPLPSGTTTTTTTHHAHSPHHAQSRSTTTDLPRPASTVKSNTSNGSTQTSSEDLLGIHTMPLPSTTRSTTTTSTALPSIVEDNLTCQWGKCRERATSPETLFDHICEKHIGRKSTNNLNLTCGWKGCSVSTVKRDHITSHIRVHVPLKPHKCEFCGKAFKRPQDLKKHVKTHAEDSGASRGNDATQNGANSFKPASKLMVDLHNVAATAAYDPASHMSTHPGVPYGYAAPNVAAAASSFYHPQAPAGYAPLYYGVNGATAAVNPVNQAHQMNQHIVSAYETKKRNYDALNEFFGEAKRRQIDPTNYAQVGQRLATLSTPMFAGSMMDYVPPLQAPAPIALGDGAGGPLVPQHYALPALPNLRTKNDLLNIDQILEQMQNTVYESSNAAAAAGVQQVGSHYTHQPINLRQSQSPPQMTMNVSATYNPTSVTATHAPLSTVTTPELTPGSSTMSYHSSDSPISTNGMSPLSQHSNISSNPSYPSLPPLSMAYAPNASVAPVARLGTQFDGDPRRRFSGGLLQKAAQHRSAAGASNLARQQTIDEATSTKLKGTTSPVRNQGANRSPTQTSATSGSSSDSGDSARDRAEEAWIENIRVIEALRHLIKLKLDRSDYESEPLKDGNGDTEMLDGPSQQEQSSVPRRGDGSMGTTSALPGAVKSGLEKPLYPTLRVGDD